MRTVYEASKYAKELLGVIAQSGSIARVNSLDSQDYKFMTQIMEANWPYRIATRTVI